MAPRRFTGDCWREGGTFRLHFEGIDCRLPTRLHPGDVHSCVNLQHVTRAHSLVSHPLVPGQENVVLYIHCPMPLQGVVLSYTQGELYLTSAMSDESWCNELEWRTEDVICWKIRYFTLVGLCLWKAALISQLAGFWIAGYIVVNPVQTKTSTRCV